MITNAPAYWLLITAVNPELSASMGIVVSEEIQRAEDLGLSLQPITLNNLSEDTCSLTWVRDIGEAPPFLPDDLVQIFQGESRPDEFPEFYRVFCGRVQPPDVSVSDGDISAVYPIHGPFGDFRRYLFTRTPYGLGELDMGEPFSLYYGETEIQFILSEVLDFSVVPIKVTPGWIIGARGHLFDPPLPFSPPTYRTLKDQVEELIQYVADRLDDDPGGATFQFDVSNWNLGTTVTPRPTTFQDRPVAELLIQALGLKPDVVLWFDYASSYPPMLRLSAASEVMPTVLTLQQPPLVSLKGRARSDLIISGVVIRYEHYDWYGVNYERGWSPSDKADVYPLSMKADDARALSVTMVGEAYWLAPDLAQVVYESMSVLRFQGLMVLYDPDRQLAIRPGRVFTIAGEHAGMPYGQLLVQSATFNTTTGEWTCTLGLPAILDIQTLRDLRGWMQLTFCGPGYSFTTRLPAPD